MNQIVAVIKKAKEPEKPPETQPEELQDSPESTEDSKPIFQGIGIIKGVVTFDDETKRHTVSFKGKTYPLCFKNIKVFRALKTHCRRVEGEVRLVVYPEATHFPGRDKAHVLRFRAVGFLEGKKGEDPNLGLQDFQFKLCGLWQFIPVCKTPCISIFKNFDKRRLEITNSREVTQRVKFMKAQHIPLFWWEALVPPFRFNPKLEKEGQAKRYFVEVKASFMPHKDSFKFEGLLGDPTEEIPRHFKASKKLKADAMAARKALKNPAAKVVLKKKESKDNAESVA